MFTINKNLIRNNKNWKKYYNLIYSDLEATNPIELKNLIFLTPYSKLDITFIEQNAFTDFYLKEPGGFAYKGISPQKAKLVKDNKNASATIVINNGDIGSKDIDKLNIEALNYNHTPLSTQKYYAPVGSEFHGTHLCDLTCWNDNDSKDYSGDLSNFDSYCKYKITRTAETLTIEPYIATVTKDPPYKVNWVFNLDGTVDWTQNPYHKNEDKTKTKTYSPKDFAEGVIPVRLLFVMSGAGGAGGYSTIWHDGGGGGGGAFVIVAVDFSKLPEGQNYIWCRVGHGAKCDGELERNHGRASLISTAKAENVVDVVVEEIAGGRQIAKEYADGSEQTIGAEGGKTGNYGDYTGGKGGDIIKDYRYFKGGELFFYAKGGKGGNGGQEQSGDTASSGISPVSPASSSSFSKIFLRGWDKNTEAIGFSAYTGGEYKDAAGGGGGSWLSSGIAASDESSRNATKTNYGAGGGGYDTGFLEDGNGGNGGSGIIKIYY